MEIYIDKAFLDNFYAKYDAENDTHRNLRKFLSKANMGKVFLDFDYSTKEEFEKATTENPFLDELVNIKSVTPTSAFREDCRSVDFYEIGSASKYFFTENTDYQIVEDNFGCIYISSSNIEKAEFLFLFDEFSFKIKDKKYADWSFIEQFKHPFNAMVITDNYLLKDSNLIAENVFGLLKRFLPQKLKTEFHLTIIGKDLPNNAMQQRYDMINRFLESTFSYKINLSIIRNDYHDRCIITNYALLQSGNSLTYFERQNIKHNTTLSFKPITLFKSNPNPYSKIEVKIENSVLETWKNCLSVCSKLNKDTQNIYSDIKVVGNKINRLL